MARMKFLCDADRCIECNACVTACKNEHEVPWGINRRRVVTINDGRPGERSVSMACMHCTDAPCAAVCPVNCVLHHRRRGGPALQGPLHRLRLLLLRVPVRRAAISAGGQLRLARQDGQVHLLRRRSGGGQLAGRVRRSTAPTGWRKASCRSAPRCARPNRCSPATARSSPRSTASAWSSAATAPAPGAGGPPIARRSRRKQTAGDSVKNREKEHDGILARIRFVVGRAGAAGGRRSRCGSRERAAEEPGRLGQSDGERRAGGAAAQAARTDRRPLHAARPEGLHARAAGRAATGAASIR